MTAEIERRQRALQRSGLWATVYAAELARLGSGDPLARSHADAAALAFDHHDGTQCFICLGTGWHEHERCESCNGFGRYAWQPSP